MPKTAKKTEPYKLGGSLEHRKIIQLKDEVRRLNGEIRQYHRDALNDNEVRRLLKIMGDRKVSSLAWMAVPAKKATNAPEVPVVLWSDWHGGEVVSLDETNGINEFNIKILKARVRKLVERTIRLADKHDGIYPGIVVNLLGDFVSGGLHDELKKTDEIEALGAMLLCRDLLIWSLDAMVAHFGKVYVPCTAGNHGRNTHKPEFKRYVYKNYDWAIFKLLEAHYKDDPRITFDIRPSNDVTYKVYNKRFFATHGDMLGVKGGDGIIGALGPIARGEVKVRGSVRGLSDYDCMLIGHWHQQIWLPRVIVNNALKGYDEYAKNNLRALPTLPSQSLFFVHPRYGITSRWEIYLEGDEESSIKADWVSVFNQRAS